MAKPWLNSFWLFASAIFGVLLPFWSEGQQPREREPIVGCWSVVEKVIFGKVVPAHLFAKNRFCFDGAKVTHFRVDGSVASRQSYQLVLKEGVGKIDIFTNDIRTGKGIVEIRNDTLAMCLGEEEQERPTTFESTDQKRFVLIRLRRLKE